MMVHRDGLVKITKGSVTSDVPSVVSESDHRLTQPADDPTQNNDDANPDLPSANDIEPSKHVLLIKPWSKNL